MDSRNLFDVVIIGAGPAGISTALHLVQADPGWAKRLVVLEKAVHPREKLCGGGVTQFGEKVLSDLGLSLEPSHIPVNEVRIVYHNRGFTIRDQPVFRVIHRAEFDLWLVRQAERQGIQVWQGEAVVALRPGDEAVEVLTENRAFHAKTVVAADGSNSVIRKMVTKDCLNANIPEGQKARVFEIVTPEMTKKNPAFQEGIAVFDFTEMSHGLQGYSWDFPSLINGTPFMNRGIFDSRICPSLSRIPLKNALQESLARRELRLTDYKLQGFPIQWFDAHNIFSRPRILLAGDAAGVDPLFGEGISFALAYGQVAAEAILDAFARQDVRFAEYREWILRHPILRQLRASASVAKIAYRFTQYPCLTDCLWFFVPIIFRTLAWYRPQYVPVDHPQLLRLRS